MSVRRRPPKQVNPFYVTPEWRAVRLLALRRDGYRCVVCGCDVRASGQARVDHIKPISTHPHLALVLSNLRTLCVTHDSQAHRERRHSGGGPRQERFVIRGNDANGVPIDPNHPWRQGR